LKSFLIASRAKHEWIHDLAELLNSCVALDASFEFVRLECNVLNGMIRLRYPADFAGREEAQEAMRAMKIVRKFIREKLGLSKPQRHKRINHGNKQSNNKTRH
jgi:HEPN domain-containing protein